MSLFGNATLVNTQAIPLGHAQKLSISYISEAITIFEGEGDALLLKEYFNDDDPDLFAEISIGEDSVVIRHGARPVPNFLRGYVELYVPRSFFGVLNVRTVSGRIEAQGRLVLEELLATSTSGRVSLGDLTAGQAVISSVSGSIGVGRLRAIADVHSTSGAVQIVSAEGAGVFKSVSGSIDVAYEMITGDITAGSTSGRVRVTVPAGQAMAVEAKSVSGRIHIPMLGSGGKRSVSGTIGDAPNVRVRINTVSGSIDLVSAG